MHFPAYLQKLIEVLRQLPGVGTKSAERFAFHLLTCPEGQLQEMGRTIAGIHAHLHSCPQCGCLTEEMPCAICRAPDRQTKQLCVVASARDVFSIERTHAYQGLYHVLGGLLSPIEGRGPECLHLESLYARVQELGVTEVVVALDATLEGDATALYLKQELTPLGIAVTRLAFGMPMGSSLDYVDGDTLGRALSGRRTI